MHRAQEAGKFGRLSIFLDGNIYQSKLQSGDLKAPKRGFSRTAPRNRGFPPEEHKHVALVKVIYI